MDYFFSSPGRRKSRLATQHLELMLQASSKSYRELRSDMINYEQWQLQEETQTRDRESQQLKPQNQQHFITGNTLKGMRYCAFVSAVREDLSMIDGSCRHVRRVFVSCADSGVYSRLGWVLSKDVHHCMLCSAAFSSSWRFKHHCRCCGNVVCEKCSPDSSRATLDALPSCSLQRVCVQCNYGQVMAIIFSKLWFFAIVQMQPLRDWKCCVCN